MNAPRCSRRVLRLGAEMLREEGRVLACSLGHIRREGGALVCAEGETFAYALFPGTEDVYAFGGHLAAYLPESAALRYLDRPAMHTAPAELSRVQSVTAADGTEYVYVLGAVALVHRPDETGHASCGLLTDTAVAAYRERVFAASGRTVKFGKLLDFSGEGWLADEAEQGRASFELHPEGGNIVDMLPVQGKLCFFREYGVTALTAYADVYNFRLADIPFDCGKIVKGSAVLCGGNAYFFTERGLCVTDGKSAARAEGAADGGIDLAAPVRVSVRGGTLYAAVTKKNGAAALYAYDPCEKCGRYLFLNFEKLSAGEGAYLMRGGAAYAPEGRGVPSGRRCELSLTISLADLYEGEKRVEAVTVEGEGAFSVTVAGEEGTATVSAAANRRAALPFAVRGECVSLTVSAGEADFRIRAVSLSVRGEERV